MADHTTSPARTSVAGAASPAGRVAQLRDGAVGRLSRDDARRHGPVYPQDAALAIAAMVAEEPDGDEVARFCSALSGHQGRPVQDVRDHLAELQLPRGLRHVRLLVEGSEAPVHRISRRDCQPVAASAILLGAQRGRGDVVPWCRVEALDVIDRGVLDLAFTYADVAGRA